MSAAESRPVRVEQIGPYLFRIPPDAKPGMRVPALVVADEALMSHLRSEASLEQLANGATLPGIVKAALAMPDIHQGYGLPVGGVVATDAEHGVVSPGAIGFDINCGVRLLTTEIDETAARAKLASLVDALYATIPTGVGGEGRVRLEARDLPAVLERGAEWAVERGYGDAADLARLESGGRIPGAIADHVSARAVERGRRQLGTLGSGNHFLELQVVDEVYDEAEAARLGLDRGRLTVMIHTGSRGLGHQVCTDYLRTSEAALRRYGISVPDRQLACAPIDSEEARTYLGAMRAAANFAFANRQVLSHWAREVLLRVFGVGPRELGARVVYDVAHNIAKEEEHEVDGRRRRLLVHRKGATRAFPGQPVLVPGDMGRYSFVLVGTDVAMRETFGSTCHGAGRLLSRTAAVKAARGRRIERELEARGVIARATGRDALAEEMPEAYKDVKDVVDVVHRFGISRRVARLKPIGVIKG
jgi:tRNA-splicing ligase RtcB